MWMIAVFVNPINLHVSASLAPKPRSSATLRWQAPTLLNDVRCAIGPHADHRFNTASAWGGSLFRAMRTISTTLIGVNKSPLCSYSAICMDKAFDKTLPSPIATVTTTSADKPLLIEPNIWAELVGVVAMASEVNNIVLRTV